MTDSNTNIFLDTCVWIGYFSGDTPKSKEFIENKRNCLFTSLLSLYEFIKKMTEKKLPESIIDNMVEIIEENSTIINLNKEIAKNASKNCIKYNLHALDSLIYSSSQYENTILITTDKHFKNLPNSLLIKTK